MFVKIKIVTDSTADLTPQLARELDIEVVPSYVLFGNQVYRDRADIGEDEFYQRLLKEQVPPVTRPPTPQDFARVYRDLSRDADGILSVHISGKLSATVNSAMRGKELLEREFPIEVVDSRLATMGIGLLAILAHDLLAPKTELADLARTIRGAIQSVHLMCYLDTLKYLAEGGRLGKARALLGSMLRVKPILSMKDGELEPVGRVRNKFGGMSKLFEFAQHSKDIQDMAIVYGTTLVEAQMLSDNLDAVFPKERIKLCRLGPVLGVHCGPGILFVVCRTRMDR
jgi:DegV family protein with EDD domain